MTGLPSPLECKEPSKGDGGVYKEILQGDCSRQVVQVDKWRQSVQIFEEQLAQEVELENAVNVSIPLAMIKKQLTNFSSFSLLFGFMGRVWRDKKY